MQKLDAGITRTETAFKRITINCECGPLSCLEILKLQYDDVGTNKMSSIMIFNAIYLGLGV